MRPIRFRAWDIENREMIRVDEINFGMEIVGTYIGTDERGDPVFRYLNFKQVILVQSTGLKDKSGVEIYEGDIVEYAGRANNHGVPWGWEFTTFGKGVVKYNLAGYSIFDLHTKNLIKEDLNEFLIRYEEIDIEVIGNIYENRELLEETNK